MIKMIKQHVFTALIVLGLHSNLETKVIVWDLGHVLFAPSKLAILKHIGLGNCLRYLSHHHKNPIAIRQKVMTVLDQVIPESTLLAQFVTESALSGITPFNRATVPADEQGTPMSMVMQYYSAGMINSEQALQAIHTTIEQLATENYFESIYEQKLIEKAIELIFTPEVFANSMHPINKGLELVKLCAAQKNEAGQPAHELMILSNWDPESFALLQNLPHGQRVFQYFKPENIIISGIFKCLAGLKPNPTLFSLLLYTQPVAPSEFIFIDDQPSNIAAARACGITAIQLENGNYKALKKELQRLGVL